MWFQRDKSTSARSNMAIATKENSWKYVTVSFLISLSWYIVFFATRSRFTALQQILAFIVIISAIVVGACRSHILMSKKGITRVQASVIANATSFVVIGVFAVAILSIIN